MAKLLDTGAYFISGQALHIAFCKMWPFNDTQPGGKEGVFVLASRMGYLSFFVIYGSAARGLSEKTIRLRA